MPDQPTHSSRALAAIAAGLSLGPVGLALSPCLAQLLPRELDQLASRLLESSADVAKRVVPRLVYDRLKTALRKPGPGRPYEKLFHDALRSVLTDLRGETPYAAHAEHVEWLDRWIAQLERPLPLGETAIDALVEQIEQGVDGDTPEGWTTIVSLLADNEAAARLENNSIILKPSRIPASLLEHLHQDLPSRLQAAVRQLLFSAEGEAAFRDATLRSFARVADRVTEALADGRVDVSTLLEHPWNRQGTLPFHFAAKTAAAIFGPTADRLIETDLPAFLGAESPVRWWLWTGLEGAGKSRLAAHACRSAIDRGWEAGFLSSDQREALAADPLRPAEVVDDTLIVIDDVGYRADSVRGVLFRLLTNRRGGGRVRVILLERHSSTLESDRDDTDLPAWYIEIFRGRQTGLDHEALRAAQYPSPGASSLHVGDFSRAEAREFARQYATASGAGDRAAAVADRAIAVLSPPGRPPQTRPLHIQLTVHVLLNSNEAQMSSFEKVVSRYLAQRVELRRQRLRKALSSPGEAERALNLMCVATLLGQVRLDEIPKLDDLPTESVRHERARLLEAFDQTARTDVLKGVEPDLIGEWFVHLWCGDAAGFGGGLTTDRLEAILDAMPNATAGVADFVQRTYRYFRNDDLWRRLSRRIGRYATPFGRLFDQRSHQLQMLGGTARQAATCYEEDVRAAIRTVYSASGLPVVLVDLMAGGSEFLQSLLTGDFEDQVHIMAIDQDSTRLGALASEVNDRARARGATPPLRVIPCRIDGRIGLDALLEREFREPTCDIVIAKKALHEIPWPGQQSLIEEIGTVVRSDTGRVIVYADAPDQMDEDGRYRLGRVRLLLDNASAPAHMTAEAREGLIARLSKLKFDPSIESHRAVFANFWIHLKDWANYNESEFQKRYFGSRNELLAQFASAGLVPASSDSSRRFVMRLAPTRFIEEAINRLGYLCTDDDVSADELAGVVAGNPRLEIFRRAVDAILWSDDGPTGFGRAVDARREAPFDLHSLVSGLGDTASRLRRVSFPSWPSTSFEMPIHVFSLRRIARS